MSRFSMGGMIILIMLLLQWDGRSLLSNGQDFKQFIASREEKADVASIQVSWLKPNLDFGLSGYIAIRKNRKEGGGVLYGVGILMHTAQCGEV